MSDETRDPREAVLVGIINTGIQSGQWKEGWTNEALTRLDAADPRLAMWGELVEALATFESRYLEEFGEVRMKGDRLDNAFWHLMGVVERARALDATTGETK